MTLTIKPTACVVTSSPPYVDRCGAMSDRFCRLP